MIGIQDEFDCGMVFKNKSRFFVWDIESYFGVMDGQFKLGLPDVLQSEDMSLLAEILPCSLRCYFRSKVGHDNKLLGTSPTLKKNHSFENSM